MMVSMRAELADARSLVVKIGTSSLLDERGMLDLPVIARQLRDLAALHRKGVRVVVVSSGAVGAGAVRLGFEKRPTTIPELQATAAVGQSVLMNTYNTLLVQEGYAVAQLLLTHEDFKNRRRYLNMRNTLAALHDKPILPVINENDTVATEEIRFGDNDMLAALVAGLLDADLTILLSDVDGFFLDGELIDEVDSITDAIEAAAGPGSGAGRGGMVTKLDAAARITRHGGHVVIANGKRHGVVDILRGDAVGTLFRARGDLDSRERWVHGLVEAGKLCVDAGGERAIRDQGRSLLPVGITACEGNFANGDAVLVVGPSGPVAKGLVNYHASEVRSILGKRTGEIAAVLGKKEFDEVIHRDNLVLLR
jgi:glutamate 5-kinase